MAACLALQWCAESSGAEISAASPGYQRETFFVNSSPTVSSLHSWLTARCVPLPCLHAASKALVFSNPASFYCTFLHRLVLSHHRPLKLPLEINANATWFKYKPQYLEFLLNAKKKKNLICNLVVQVCNCQVDKVKEKASVFLLTNHIVSASFFLIHQYNVWIIWEFQNF